MQSDPTAINTENLTELDRMAVVNLAKRDRRVREGELEVDDNAIVSWGSDNGAYVQAWLWVDFQGTSMDTEAEQRGEDA